LKIKDSLVKYSPFTGVFYRQIKGACGCAQG
jgi:hypothetical protein